jgi:hypothetical protein
MSLYRKAKFFVILPLLVVTMTPTLACVKVVAKEEANAVNEEILETLVSSCRDLTFKSPRETAENLGKITYASADGDRYDVDPEQAFMKDIQVLSIDRTMTSVSINFYENVPFDLKQWQKRFDELPTPPPPDSKEFAKTRIFGFDKDLPKNRQCYLVVHYYDGSEGGDKATGKATLSHMSFTSDQFNE